MTSPFTSYAPHMAATGVSRPWATLVTLAALLALGGATPASASRLNFYRGQRCTGEFLLSCGDLACCVVPGGAVSYEFHYVPGFVAHLYKDPSCSGLSHASLPYEVACKDFVGFKSAIITDYLAEMAAE